MCAGHGKEVDAKGVADNAERENGERKNELAVKAGKKHLTGNETGNEENKTGPNTAALLCNHDR